MATHELRATENNLHSYFSKDLAPILTIDAGDTIVSNTLDAGWGVEAPKLDGTERKKIQYDTMRGHCLVGPVAINGTQAGQMLEVQINEIVTGDYGFTYGGGFDHPIHQYLGTDSDGQDLLLWSLDAEKNTATNQLGHRIQMNPFLGVLGVAPAEDGEHSTPPPRKWGGNIDCKLLQAGTTLYLPIGVDGALFSFGDGHAAQGDGEVSVQAIECPMTRVSLTLNVADKPLLQTPHARIDGAWVTFGFDESLHLASLQALAAMVKLMQHRYSLNQKQALALASPVVDLHITQIANPTLGVHAILRDNAIATVLR